MSGGTGKGASARDACRALSLLFDAEGPRAVFITGNAKGCGRTTLLSWAAADRAGRGLGSRFLSSGLDTPSGGSGGGADAGGGSPAREGVKANPGDLALTAESLIRGFSGRFELLDRLRDRTSGEWFVCVRIARAGVVPLLGPRDPAVLRQGVETLLRFPGQGPAMVDGPAGRLTQIAALPDASFIHVLAVTPQTRGTALAFALRLAALSRLPLFEEPRGSAVGPATVPRSQEEPRGSAVGHEAGAGSVIFIQGALNEPILRGLPKDTDAVVVEDFTKVFCAVAEAEEGAPAGVGARAVAGTGVSPRVFVKRAYPLLGIVLNPRGMDSEETAAEFSARIGKFGIPVSLHPLFLCGGEGGGETEAGGA